MNITYDAQVDTLYIQLNDKPRKRGAKTITDRFVLDFDVDGNVQGIEILEASQSVDNPREAWIQLLNPQPDQPEAE